MRRFFSEARQHKTINKCQSNEQSSSGPLLAQQKTTIRLFSLCFFLFTFSNNEYRKQEQHWHDDDCSKQGEGIGPSPREPQLGDRAYQ
jgi:hypothetical protein